MKQKSSKNILKVIPAVIAALVIGGSAFAFAMIDESNSVHIKANEIENSTLIIGSHLIHLSALTEQNYAIAVETEAEANQYTRYYKSELVGGVWYDVTEAESLADITTAGRVVENSEVESLNMTHHTKSDGITYDLRSGKSVSVFDINNPYDLESMKELEPIKMQYDMLVQNQDPSETNERDIKVIEEIFQKERETDVTKEYDAALKSLQSYYEALVQGEAEASMSNMVMKVMEKIDNARRAEVFQPLNDTELEAMNNIVSREYEYAQGEVTGVASKEELYGKDVVEDARKAAKEAREEAEEAGKDPEAAAKEAEEAVYAKGRPALEIFTLNTGLSAAIGEAIGNVQDSYIEYSSNLLDEGTTVLSRVEYELAQRLISMAKNGNHAGCDGVVMELIYLNNINNSVVKEEEAERTFITDKLIYNAESAYRNKLFAGASSAYKDLVSSLAANATKQTVLKQQKDEAEIARNELQFIIQAYFDRLPVETAMEYTAERIENIDTLRNGIQEDAYKEYALTSVEAHLDWLNQTMKRLEGSAGNRAMDSLLQQKEELQAERKSAIEKNQWGLLNQLDAQIEAIDNQLGDLEAELNDILNSEQTSDAEKARAAAQLGEGSASATLQQMKNNALEDIRNGNTDGIGDLIDGIGAMAGVRPEGAMGALKDIYQELSNQKITGGLGAGEIDNLVNKLEDVIAEQMEHFAEDISKDDMGNLIDAFAAENGMGSGADRFGGIGGAGGAAGTGGIGGAGGAAGMGGGASTGAAAGAGATSGADAFASNLADTMAGLSDADLAAILAGMNMYVEQTGSVSAKNILLEYSRMAAASGSIYVYEQLSSDRTAVYAPTDCIGHITGHRYIFNDTQKAVTLQKGSQYFKFKAFSAIVERGATLEDMIRPAGFQGVIYIPEEAVASYFNLKAVYIQNTKYGIVMTEELHDKALRFFDYLLEAGGGF